MGEEKAFIINGVQGIVKNIGVFSETRAAISIDGIADTVYEKHTHTINDVNVYINNIEYNEQDCIGCSVTLTIPV